MILALDIQQKIVEWKSMKITCQGYEWKCNIFETNLDITLAIPITMKCAKSLDKKSKKNIEKNKYAKCCWDIPPVFGLICSVGWFLWIWPQRSEPWNPNHPTKPMAMSANHVQNHFHYHPISPLPPKYDINVMRVSNIPNDFLVFYEYLIFPSANQTWHAAKSIISFLDFAGNLHFFSKVQFVHV